MIAIMLMKLKPTNAVYCDFVTSFVVTRQIINEKTKLT